MNKPLTPTPKTEAEVIAGMDDSDLLLAVITGFPFCLLFEMGRFA